MTTTSVQNERKTPPSTGPEHTAAPIGAAVWDKTADRSRPAEHTSTVATLIIVAFFPALALYESRPSAYDTLVHQFIGTLCIVMHLLLRVKSAKSKVHPSAVREGFTEVFLFIGLGFFYPTALVWLFLLMAWFWKRLSSVPPADGHSRPELLRLLGYSTPSSRHSSSPPAADPDFQLALAALVAAVLHVSLRAAGLSSALTASAPLVLFAWDCARVWPLRRKPVGPNGSRAEQ